MKICIDDGSTNIKLAWTENGERRNAISPNSFKSEWSAPFGGTQPANYMLDGVRYGFDPVSDRFVQTTDTQYQYSDVNVIAIHHALVKSGITPQEVDVVVTLPLSEYFDTNAQPDMANINRKKAQIVLRREKDLKQLMSGETSKTWTSGEETVYCSFCNKSQYEVTKVIAGPSVYICNECVDLCNEIIRKEVTDKKEKNA